MVSNAKYYNEKGTLLFSNAERIRKIVAAEMHKLNPAYGDPNYVPFSTPVPDLEESTSERSSPKPESQHEDGGIESVEVGQTDIKKQLHDSTTEPSGDITQTFEGDSFEAAQERIISELIRLKDAEYGS